MYQKFKRLQIVSSWAWDWAKLLTVFTGLGIAALFVGFLVVLGITLRIVKEIAKIGVMIAVIAMIIGMGWYLFLPEHAKYRIEKIGVVKCLKTRCYETPHVQVKR